MTPMRRLLRSDRGAIMLMGVFMAIFLCACLFYVVSIGQTILYRTHMQDAADSVAMASAVVHAKGMNALVFINIIMAALLAVLVALRLISTVASAIGVIAGAMCIYPPFAILCSVPASMATVVADVEDVYDSVKDPVELALQGLHALSVVVRSVTPGLGTAKALAVAKVYYKDTVYLGIAIPSALSLPTEDDTFEHLCEKAGDLTGDLVQLPFEPIPVIKEVIGGVLNASIDALTASAPSWFCGGENSAPPKTKAKFTHYKPTLAIKDACDKATANNDDYAKDICAQAETETRDAEPDNATGECQTRCDDDGPYMERVRKARLECNPDRSSGLHTFQYQYRQVTRYMVREAGGARVEREEVHAAERRESKNAPCSANNHGWNPKIDLPAWRDSIAPVCVFDFTLTESKDGLHFQYLTEEVTHVFSCAYDEEIEFEPTSEGGLHSGEDDPQGENDSKDGESQDNSTNMSPQKMNEGLHNGGGEFQVRGFVFGREFSRYGESLMRVAAREAEDTAFTKARQAGRLQFAQAEFYFADSTDDLDLMMWRMKWTARMRRFRLGGYDDEDEDSSQSPTSLQEGGAPGSSDESSGFDLSTVKDMCSGTTACDLLDSFDSMDLLVVH